MDDVLSIDRRHVWHPYTRRSTLDREAVPVVERGEGVWLIDVEGRRYLDAIASWWSCSLGHSHPEIVAAIREQAGRLQHSILANMTHPGAIRLSELLAGLMPDDRRHVHYASDGASAVEIAMKIAIQYFHNVGEPGRTRFARLEESYHGDTLGTVSVGYLERFHEAFRDVVFPSAALPVPLVGRGEEEVALERARSLMRERGPSLAALVVEPLCQGAGGIRIYAASYLKALHDLCREAGCLLICDEIAMGFGRTGTMFAFEQAGIDPDIVCLGKAVTGGALPLSAAVVKDAIYDAFGDEPDDHTFYHGHTFAGNPLACAAAEAAVGLTVRERLPARAARAEPVLREALEPLRALPNVRDARALGMIGAVEMQSADAAARVRRALLDRGILLRPLGPVVYVMPPLVIDDDTLARLLREFAGAVRNA
jgi:adenosylmethionine---8-amino-7-oxononanoate aminotransferase